MPRFKRNFLADIMGNAGLRRVALLGVLTACSVQVALSGQLPIFDLPPEVALGAPIGDFIISDLNHDGNKTILTTRGGGSMKVYRQNGAGQFTLKQTLSSFSQYRFLPPVDLNRDGKLDVIGWGSNESTTVVLNDGTGLFGSRSYYEVSTPFVIRAIVVADLNGDGAPEIAETTSEGKVILLMNDGHGAISADAVTYSVGDGAGDLVAVDLNGDHFLDLAVLGGTFGPPSESHLAVFFNDGHGVFSAPVLYGIDAYVISKVRAADLDGDGDADLIVSDSALDEGTGFKVFLNNGSGGFGRPTEYPGLYVGTFVADLNGDNRADLVYITYSDRYAVPILNPQLAIRLNQGDGTFGAPTYYPAVDGSSFVSAADFDHDGIIDLLIDSVGEFSIFFNDGHGDFSRAIHRSYQRDHDVNYHPGSWVAGADFTNDGNLDIVIYNNRRRALSLLRNDGAGSFSEGAPPVVITQGSGPVKLIDVNQDGKPDLVSLRRVSTSEEAVGINLNTGNAAFGPPVFYPVNGVQASDVVGLKGALGLDLAVTNEMTNSVSILRNIGGGAFGSPVTYPVGGRPVGIVAADFNGDGYQDLATVNTTGGNVSVLLNDGMNNFGVAANFPSGSGPVAIVAADFDHDGDIDLAVARYYGAGNIELLLNNGAGVFSDGGTILVGGAQSTLVVGDWNEDGLPDLAAYNPLANGMVILTNHGGGSFSIIQTLPPFEYGPAWPNGVADVNGDGHLDLVGTAPTTGYMGADPSNDLVVFLNQGNGMFNPVALRVATGWKPFIGGDLDHDGDLDFIASGIAVNYVAVLLNARRNGVGEIWKAYGR